MGLFSWFKRKPKTELKTLKTEKLGAGYRIAKASQRNYKVKMVLTFEGKPVRQFEVIIKANSRGNAAFKAKKEVSLEVTSAYVIKQKEEE